MTTTTRLQGVTLAERLAEVVADMDALCAKYDLIGAGHAAQPIRDFARRIEAALAADAGEVRNARTY
jgi:hypothetical protein